MDDDDDEIDDIMVIMAPNDDLEDGHCTQAWVREWRMEIVQA